MPAHPLACFMANSDFNSARKPIHRILNKTLVNLLFEVTSVGSTVAMFVFDFVPLKESLNFDMRRDSRIVPLSLRRTEHRSCGQSSEQHTSELSTSSELKIWVSHTIHLDSTVHR